MAHSYRFAVVRLNSAESRDERLNVGLVIANGDTLDVRVARRLDKVHAISSALDSEDVRSLLEGLASQDEGLRQQISDVDERMRALFRVGPVSLSELGSFSAETAESYETRVASVMRALVEPEPSAPKVREKRSRLLTQVKQAFRRERVLAQRGENIEAHRLVSAFAIDEGLTADLALRNGAMHIVETADATGEQDALRKAVAEIAVSALVLERARMKFGENETKTKLVYSASSSIEKAAIPSLDAAAHQGTELVNWLSAHDRERFINSLSSLAEPVPRKRKTKMLHAEFANEGRLF